MNDVRPKNLVDLDIRVWLTSNSRNAYAICFLQKEIGSPRSNRSDPVKITLKRIQNKRKKTGLGSKRRDTIQKKATKPSKLTKSTTIKVGSLSRLYRPNPNKANE